MILCRNILGHLSYRKVKHVLLGKKKDNMPFFNTVIIIGSHFPDPNWKVKYKLLEEKDGIFIFPKEDISSDFTQGDSFYQLSVYVYDIYLDHCYSIYLFILAANVPKGKCLCGLLFLLF